MEDQPSHRLQWRAQELSKFGRHFVAEQPVHCGDYLELMLDDGSWARGRYEWNPAAGGTPMLELGEVRILLTKDSIVRWPR